MPGWLADPVNGINPDPMHTDAVEVNDGRARSSRSARATSDRNDVCSSVSRRFDAIAILMIGRFWALCCPSSRPF